MEPPRGPVEAEFLRRLVLGESVLPFRMLEGVTAVIPLDNGRMLNSIAARAAGHRHLAGWLEDVEVKWAAHANKGADGAPRMTLSERLDHMRTLSGQAGEHRYRILATKSGSRLSSAIMGTSDTIIEQQAYWAVARSLDEARYVTAILNSLIVETRIREMQVIGEAGTRRHIDNLVWTLPIPEYDDTEPLHCDLAAAGGRAEAVAAVVALSETQHFTGKRRAIRAALIEDGVAGEIEALVDALLPP